METNVKEIVKKFLHSIKSSVMAMDVETLKENSLQEVYEGVKEITSLVTPPAPEVKPDFEPIDFTLAEMVGQFTSALNGKHFRLNNGVSINSIILILQGDNYFYSNNGSEWTNGVDNVLSASQLGESDYEFSYGIDGPMLGDFAVLAH